MIFFSPGSAFASGSNFDGSLLTGVAVSGLGSSLVLENCSVSGCAHSALAMFSFSSITLRATICRSERVLAEASNRSRLLLLHCALGASPPGADQFRCSGIGTFDGGSGGGGVLVRHHGTSALIACCSIVSTRLASVDVREGANLQLTSTLLFRGRTSGIFASENASVIVAECNTISSFRIAAIEVASGARVLCAELSDPQDERPDGTRGELMLLDCPVKVLVSSGAAFGVEAPA